MGRPLASAALAAALATLSACTGSAPTPAPNPASIPASSPSALSSPAPAPGGRPFAVTAQDQFGDPWAMSFLPGTRWLAVTERTGTLWLRDQDTGARVEVTGVPAVVAAGQGGLGDVVPAPGFAENGLLYLSWAERGDGGVGAAVGRARLVADGATAHLEGLSVIWRQAPKTDGSGHFSHRIAFSPDGAHLFVSSGDRQKMEPAQDLGTTLGTIVRLTPEGAPAPGNPFADRGGAAAEIWSYGHRNPLGLAFDTDGRLWSTEMGPQGGDELNLITPGANYGWPRASQGSHYGGRAIPDHAAGDGFIAPVAWWNPSVSPGSLLIYSGDRFPAWTGDAFVGALSGRALIRIDLDGERATIADTWDLAARIRAVAQAPDGSLWLLEDAPSGRLLRLDPAG
ncbi:MAG: PQQ-dependent sugar dehydrogenase [Propioniciclava sp.]|uniref:PQQ-dependent sugar dehydrogenase n=1 Tax=Propioniciclava sp. TaxID=2038686 RepID=UPI0039E5FDD1